MTYNVFSGTLNPTQSMCLLWRACPSSCHICDVCFIRRFSVGVATAYSLSFNTAVRMIPTCSASCRSLFYRLFIEAVN